jgi:hypothetical protein
VLPVPLPQSDSPDATDLRDKPMPATLANTSLGFTRSMNESFV